jgi:hypothetical protein
VYVVWLEKIPFGQYRVMLATSNDGGNTFRDPVTLSENATVETYPKISAFNNHVHVTWDVEEEEEDQPHTKSGVYFVSSSDNGTTFSKIAKLNKEDKDFGEPQVTSFENQVYVIWGGSDYNKVTNLNFIKSNDNGRTFTEINKIDETKLGKLNNPTNVEIATDGANRLFIAWQDRPSTAEKDEILFTTSLDGGESFGDNTNLSNNADISECPSVVVYGDNIYVTWEDLSPGNHEVLYRHGSLYS